MSAAYRRARNAGLKFLALGGHEPTDEEVKTVNLIAEMIAEAIETLEEELHTESG